MKTARHIATFSFYLSRLSAWLFTITLIYTAAMVLLASYTTMTGLPVDKSEPGVWTLYFPFTHSPFMLLENTRAYLITNFSLFVFYTCFLWLLSGVFSAFRKERLFTRYGVRQLTRFYLVNGIPILLLFFFLLWRQELADILRLSILHLIIGVFAFFMAAIFTQGVILQEEQDLTF